MSVIPLNLMPQAGDIIGANLPLHTHKGIPGPDFRLCIVLGLEVDEEANRLEGLWLIRLSERLEKVRSWDYYLPKEQLASLYGAELNRDFVVRTPRIDLLPATHDYVGSMPVFGHLRSCAWDGLSLQIDHGQHSHFAENTYGPRAQLPHTVVKTNIGNDDSFSRFDYQSVLASLAMPSIAPDLDPDSSFARARRQQNRQERTIGQMIHEDFVAARQTTGSWNFETYCRTVLAPRMAMVRGGQRSDPAPRP